METKGHNKKLRKSTTPSISRAGSWPFLYSMYRGNRHIFPLGAIKSNPLPRQTYTHTNEAKRRNSSLCNYLCAWHTRWIHTHTHTPVYYKDASSDYVLDTHRTAVRRNTRKERQSQLGGYNKNMSHPRLFSFLILLGPLLVYNKTWTRRSTANIFSRRHWKWWSLCSLLSSRPTIFLTALDRGFLDVVYRHTCHWFRSKKLSTTTRKTIWKIALKNKKQKKQKQNFFLFFYKRQVDCYSNSLCEWLVIQRPIDKHINLKLMMSSD